MTSALAPLSLDGTMEERARETVLLLDTTGSMLSGTGQDCAVSRAVTMEQALRVFTTRLAGEGAQVRGKGGEAGRRGERENTFLPPDRPVLIGGRVA